MSWKSHIPVASVGDLPVSLFPEVAVAELEVENDDHPRDAAVVRVLVGLAVAIAPHLQASDLLSVGSRASRTILIGIAILSLTTGIACQQRLVPSDGSGAFGEALDVEGDTAILGDSAFDFGKGAAYVFAKSGILWTERQKLLPNDGTAGQDFGKSISMDGDTVLVGSRREDDNGSVYVFVRSGTTWTHQQKLRASDGSNTAFFGASVSVDGDTVVVGASQDALVGSAYVFVRSGATWTEQQKLTEDTDGFSFFGISVAVDGDTALVGAPGTDIFGETHIVPSAAYVFVRNGTTWTLQQKLTPGGEIIFNGFGSSVSLERNTAVVGASLDDDLGVESGSVYVFVRLGTTWTEQQKLHATDGGRGDRFGESVSLDGDLVVVGAPFDGDGSAYMFLRRGTTWTEQPKLTPFGEPQAIRFGRSVSVDGDAVLVGAVDGDYISPSPAYVFDLRLINPGAGIQSLVERDPGH